MWTINSSRFISTFVTSDDDEERIFLAKHSPKDIVHITYDVGMSKIYYLTNFVKSSFKYDMDNIELGTDREILINELNDQRLKYKRNGFKMVSISACNDHNIRKITFKFMKGNSNND